MTRAALLLVTALALGPTQAGAHARLLHALPKVGATVSRAPAELRLWFSEAIEPAFSTITLSGADGRPATTGRLSLDPQDRRVAIVPIPVALPPAAYRVRWRVTSTDSHRTEGDFTFTIKP